MDKQKTIEVLEALANGVDPVSGEIFPEDSPFQDVTVTRALFHAISLINDTKSNKKQPPNQGSKWTPNEDQQLKDNFNKGWKVAELAKHHQRSSGAIRSRLVKIGVVNNDTVSE